MRVSFLWFMVVNAQPLDSLYQAGTSDDVLDIMALMNQVRIIFNNISLKNEAINSAYGRLSQSAERWS